MDEPPKSPSVSAPWWATLAEKFGYPALVSLAIGYVFYSYLGKWQQSIDEVHKEMVLDRQILINREPRFNELIKNQAVGLAQSTAEEKELHDHDRDVQAADVQLNAKLQAIEKRLDDVFGHQGTGVK